MMDAACAPIRHPIAEPPAPGAATEVAEGVLWLRIPLPMALDHVNVFALDDGDGWTLVDTGLASRKGRALWQAALDGPLAGKPVRRVIVTHHHPDHVGLAGWFQDRGAELVTTRTAWMFARMLTLDEQPQTTAQSLAFQRRAGVAPAVLAQLATVRPFNFADVVAPLPVGFTRIRDGDRLRAGGRDWLVRTGDGHAPEHATLWSLDDALVLGGDQILPGISPNIGVYPTEPAADPLAEWLDSCARFAALAEERHLVLPGHKLPFTGLPLRLAQMTEGHVLALDRLRAHLARPRRAVECFSTLVRRDIDADNAGLALAETVAHLNHLAARGAIRAVGQDGDGATLWQDTERAGGADG
jgi:glyoxylase-like metal-dependent hydrolase (beta-lactamase superfamily II)